MLCVHHHITLRANFTQHTYFFSTMLSSVTELNQKYFLHLNAVVLRPYGCTVCAKLWSALTGCIVNPHNSFTFESAIQTPSPTNTWEI